MGYERHDAWYRKAQREHLRARSAFKLDEIQKRWKLVRAGSRVVDLGAAPGGFLQVLAEIVGPKGRVVGVDLEEIRPLGGVVTVIQADVSAPDLGPRLREALGGSADVLTSDLAPKTTGVRDADEARSLALVERARDLAVELLRPGGHFVAKVFMGPGFDALKASLAGLFEEVRVVRPEATRAASRETYVAAMRRRAG